MNIKKKLTAITRYTRKGNTLSNPHTSAIDRIRKGSRTPFDLAMLNQAYIQLKEGSYKKLKNYHFGIEHITKSIDGSLYYKGLHIAHFAFYNREWLEEWKATHSAAKICTLLEDKGLPIKKYSSSLLIDQYLTPEEIAACLNVEAEMAKQMDPRLTFLKNRKLLHRLKTYSA